MRPQLTVFLTVFIDLLGFGIVIPLLPVYSKAYGSSEATLGLLFASFSGMQFMFAPLWGRLSDRIGRRPVIVGGLVGTSLSYLLFAHADTMALLFASRLLAGFFGANLATAQAYMADVSKPEDRAKAMGLIGAAFGIGFTVGPLVGGELTSLSPHAPGYAAAALSFAAAAFGFFNLPEVQRSKAGERVFGLDQVRVLFSDSRIGTVFVLNFLAIAAFSCFEAMFTRYGLARFPHEFGVDVAIENATQDQILASAKYSGRYLGFIGVVSALVQGGLIRRLVPRFGEVKLIIAGPLLLGLSFAIIGFASSWWVVIVGCVLMPIGFGLNNPSLTSLMSRASPDDQQGAFLGIGQSLASLARVVAPPLAGFCFVALGPRSPFWLGAATLALAAWIASGYCRRYAATFPRKAAAPSLPM
jgi:multidrug resistance protein